MKTGVKINKNVWTQSIVQKSYSAEIEAVMTAKPQSVSGELLQKDAFDMSLECEIISEREYKDRFGPKPDTKAVPGGKSETFTFRVPVGSGGSESIKAHVAPLKFNKHFVFSYTVDDSYVNGWSRIFAVNNGKWIDDVEFFHKDAVPTEGSKGSPLCISDGCGNDRRFTFGEAIWPNANNSYNPDGLIRENTVSPYVPYMTWEELQIFVDMGNAVYWHDIDTTKYSDNTIEGIVGGFKYDYDKTLEKLGYTMRTLAQPNGNPIYIEAAEKSPLVCLTRATLEVDDIFPKEVESLYKLCVFGGTSPGTVSEKLSELKMESVSDRPKLISMLSHRPTMEEVGMFREICRLYGRDGKDNIWVTSYDELYDYIEMRRSAEITETVKDGYKYFEITVPDASALTYKELTFIIDGTDTPAEIVSDNLYGFSSAVQGDGSVLVNCNFDESLPKRAGKFISRYENGFNDDDKENAEYLISLLRDDIAAPLKDKLYDLKEPTRENMPVIGHYSRNQMKYYLKLYPDHSVSASLKW
ncbi:MAG: hypothetical protein MJZ17_03465 [Bacteroidales bacterium]|nr:hypothetical protein [Bacteroidales bacterium]